ncbi:tRNA-dihydrouridine(20a/20b) synthase [NAD(P)+]-like isoform X2 [Lineus longissimus]|uniref:tRNA-dihydrouridine(20a/20b) synthase [NAD(P)+]-like isoform X2 n=1 Tax=Lineus longissimus TaxID=88925 RepID=UPI00315D903F
MAEDDCNRLGFRTLVRKYGCDLAYTPMTICDSFIKSQKARDSEFTTNKTDRPLIVQFAARNAEELAEAAEIVVPFADGVGLNCGCPQKWAVSSGYGACLLKKPELLADMVRQVKSRVPDDFTMSVKIRLHSHLRTTVDMCQKAEHAGAAWVAVHGRRADQRTEPVELEAIKQIKDSLGIPVVANGDIKSLADIRMVKEATGVNGVMVARGLLENPAMFAGYDYTPLECIRDWVDISMSTGTPFQTFHHHLIEMLQCNLSSAERRIFNSLTSTSATIDYVEEHFGA